MAIQLRDVTDSFSTPVRGGIVDGCRVAPISRTIDAGGITFGQPCFSTAQTHIASATPGGSFLGIALADEGDIPLPFGFGGATSFSPLDGSLNNAPLPAGDFVSAARNFSIATAGRVWVLVGEAVLRTAPAFVTPAGALVGTAAGNVAIPASFVLAAAAGTLVPLRIGSL